MATVNYILKGKNNPTGIFIRFKHGNKYDITTSTHLQIPRADWSQKKQSIKLKLDNSNYAEEINDKLTLLKTEILKKFNIDFISGNDINLNWLKNSVLEVFGRVDEIQEKSKTYLSDYFNEYIEEASEKYVGDKKLSYKSIQIYNTVLKRVLLFESEVNKSKLKFSEIDLHFHTNYLNKFLNIEKYGKNTIGKDIRIIKQVVKDAEINGIEINTQINHKNFFIPKEETIDTYLTEEEINKVYSYDFSSNERLNNTRDLFIIGLRTGLRVSDFLRLNKSDIKDDFIEITTLKTSQKVVIPLHKQIKEILERNNGSFPRQISDVKFNKYIKEVCKEVGINQIIRGKLLNPTTKRKEEGDFEKYKLISSHTCRRSFASNLYGKIPTTVIMAITGHSTEKMFLKYIKVTNKEFAEKLKEHYENE